MPATSSSRFLLACARANRSEEHTSELQSQSNLVCRLLLEKIQKVSEQIFPDRGQNGLGMDLHPFDAQLLVAQAHDLSLRGFSRNLNAFFQGGAPPEHLTFSPPRAFPR